MYFSTIDISDDIWSDGERLDLLRADDEFHRFIWSLFPPDPDTSRDFVYRAATNETPPSFVVISQRKPKSTAGTRIRTTEYEPHLVEGDRLAFQTRVNPIVQRSRGPGKNSAKHDVVMDAKFRDDQREESEATQYERVTVALRDWFQRKAERDGFELDDDYFRVAQYRQHQISRGKGKRPITFSSADCSGTLTVTDPVKFRELALLGVGSSRAFGCGLLVLRRA